ncbi:MAG: 4-(cytidine 5'-diphospho)-2-C-methyl-D-erythritol kinase [Lachnospiraceae bacterium]|jgi:4-diphosphocytidyl-2-C-methyl-D-erythritol kinase
MDTIKVKARGKINLGLDVLGRRPDGYHEVRMVMQTVGLYDSLEIAKIPEEEIRIETNLKYLPVDENNLVYKAVRMMKETTGFSGGVHVNLHKFIPVSAGMAGGSTDAAGVMFGVNKLFGLGLSLSQMMEMGLKLGADVPYCLMRGTALAEGIGEKLTRIPAAPHMDILLAKPRISVSTRMVYEKLDSTPIASHPDTMAILKAIAAGDVNALCASMGNVLESVTIPMYPVIAKLKRQMLDTGAIGAMMSGSGPTVFGIYPDAESCTKARDVLRRTGDARQVYTTETFNPSGFQGRDF